MNNDPKSELNIILNNLNNLKDVIYSLDYTTNQSRIMNKLYELEHEIRIHYNAIINTNENKICPNCKHKIDSHGIIEGDACSKCDCDWIFNTEYEKIEKKTYKKTVCSECLHDISDHRKHNDGLTKCKGSNSCLCQLDTIDVTEQYHTTIEEPIK